MYAPVGAPSTSAILETPKKLSSDQKLIKISIKPNKS
jgi:hypothetical protein